MIDALMVSNILAWLIIIAMGIALYALTRQIGLLHERMGPVGALTVAKGLKAGEPMPHLHLPSLTGGEITIGRMSDRSTLLFFLSPDCPVCKSLLPVIASVAARERDWLDIVLASDGDDVAAHARYIEAQGLQKYPYVLSSELGLAIGVSKLPYAALVDNNAKMVAHGLTNTREHIESLFEAKRQGHASIQSYLEGEQRRA